MTEFSVGSEAELRAAFIAVNPFGSASGSGYHQITLTADITLTGDLPALDTAAAWLITITGAGHTLSGGGVARGIYAYSGTVLYQAPLMLTHEEWVNGAWYKSLPGAPPPANPVRDTNGHKE